MKVACYHRYSSRKRLRERAELQGWFNAHGISSAEVAWYSEKGTDTSSSERPELGRLEQDIAAGTVDVVVLWKLSDLVTRFRAVLTTLSFWFERGVRVVIVSDGIDLQPETSRAISPLLRALADTELEYRRDRQKRGIAAAKTRGHYPGRKPGSTKEKPRRAATLRGKGYTVAEIAEMLGVSKRTAFRYLSNFQDKKSKVASKGPSHEN